MKRLRIYVDTSVFGGCDDDEFRTASGQLVERFIGGEMVAVISEITELELKGAPQQVKDVLSRIPEGSLERLKLTKEAADLAREYVSEDVIPAKRLADAQHIAIATASGVDVLVSWNFMHMVNLERIRGVNAVNLRMGYALLDIRSPREVIAHEEG